MDVSGEGFGCLNFIAPKLTPWTTRNILVASLFTKIKFNWKYFWWILSLTSPHRGQIAFSFLPFTWKYIPISSMCWHHSIIMSFRFRILSALLNQGMKSNFAYIWKPVWANVLKVASLEIHTVNQQRPEFCLALFFSHSFSLLIWLSPCLCVMLCYELKQANNLSRRCSKLANP